MVIIVLQMRPAADASFRFMYILMPLARNINPLYEQYHRGAMEYQLILGWRLRAENIWYIPVIRISIVLIMAAESTQRDSFKNRLKSLLQPAISECYYGAPKWYR